LKIKLTDIASDATLATSVGAIAAKNEQPAYGLIALVPLVDTNPDLASNPWGNNENSPGLTSHRLLDDLKAAFEGENPGWRDHWHSNPDSLPFPSYGYQPEILLFYPKVRVKTPKLRLSVLASGSRLFLGTLVRSSTGPPFSPLARLYLLAELQSNLQLKNMPLATNFT